MANEEFIKLAALGKDAWNKWAQENSKATVDFSGRKFKEADFSGFIFPGDSNFENCDFGKVLFSEAEFKGKAKFSHAKFRAYVALDRIAFRNDAIFENARFEKYAYVVHSVFKFANFKSAMSD